MYNSPIDSNLQELFIMMTFDNVVTALIAKFGENTIVRTKDALEHIEALGLRSGDYYIDMRETYGIARGKLCFGTTPSDDNDDFIADVVEVETDEQIEQRINERFEALDIMARATAKGINRCLLLSGPDSWKQMSELASKHQLVIY